MTRSLPPSTGNCPNWRVRIWRVRTSCRRLNPIGAPPFAAHRWRNAGARGGFAGPDFFHRPTMRSQRALECFHGGKQALLER